jgi:hypothetical protein
VLLAERSIRLDARKHDSSVDPATDAVPTLDTEFV